MKPESEARVRLAGRGDAVMLHLIAIATFPMACAQDTPAEDVAVYMDEQLSVERFRSRLESDRRTLFISEIAGTPAGYAMLNHSASIPDDVVPMLQYSPSVELSKFYLLAGRQGTGLGDQLMTVVLDTARERGATSVWLSVHTDNVRAQSFYEKYGFERRGLKIFRVGSRLENYFITEMKL